MIEEILTRLTNNQSLPRETVRECFVRLLEGEFEPKNQECFGALLAAMQTKGPTVEELSGLMDAVLDHDRKPVSVDVQRPCGIVGSGRDDFKTFNISTAAAIVASGLGVSVVKNGSRSETGVSGTTDVLEELGVNVGAEAELMVSCLEEHNIGFFDAAPYFPRMAERYVGKIPFINPLSYALSVASAVPFKRMVFGLSTPNTEFTAEILQQLGFEHALVVCGRVENSGEYFDELSTLGPTKISEVTASELRTYTIHPQDFGIDSAVPDDVKQLPSHSENARRLYETIAGFENNSCLDIAALNAGALLFVSQDDVSLQDCVQRARSFIESGEAVDQLECLVRESGGSLDTIQSLERTL